MNVIDNNSIITLEQAISARISSGDAKKWLEEYAFPFHELMAYYKCAIMKIETKFKILDTYYSIGNDCNHIESIHTRLKSPLSIIDKLYRKNEALTISNIENRLNDIAGVRVVCSFVSDIYKLEETLLKQDDVKLLRRKDYIATPKPNGYRSLHLIIETPIFLQNEKRQMRVEVQLRTLAMDTWASLEHKIRYKKEQSTGSTDINKNLLDCAKLCADLDQRLEQIQFSNNQA